MVAETFKVALAVNKDGVMRGRGDGETIVSASPHLRVPASLCYIE